MGNSRYLVLKSLPRKISTSGLRTIAHAESFQTLPFAYRSSLPLAYSRFSYERLESPPPSVQSRKFSAAKDPRAKIIYA